MELTEKKEGSIVALFYNGVYLGYCMQEESGKYVFVFSDNNKGTWGVFELQLIIDKLNKLNLE
jgi:hypothetical protein